MGTHVTFDSGNRLIVVTKAPVAGIVTLDVQTDLYSDMKEDWRASAVLAANPPAFLGSEGGVPTSTGFTGQYYFINNAEGWRIQPYDADHELYLVGNILAIDSDLPWWVARAGRTVVVSREFSNLAQGVETGGGGTASVEQVKQTYAVDAVADELVGVVWLESGGEIVTNPTGVSVSLQDEDGVPLFTMTSNAPDAAGFFKVTRPSPGFAVGRVFKAVTTVVAPAGTLTAGYGMFTVG